MTRERATSVSGIRHAGDEGAPRGEEAEARSLGTLIIIGGGEEKDGDAEILTEVARCVGGGRLIVTAVASEHPEEMFEMYRIAFGALGVEEVVPLHIHDRKDAMDDANVRAFDGASGIFFTGGDQLRITSHIGDTKVEERVRDLYESGGVVAGTSAGASAMGDTMMVSGPSDASHRLGDLLRLAQGLELIEGLIIDQHFAERGRMGRLLGAVAQNPGTLAIGVDENTAVVVRDGTAWEVIGDGTVYVVDGEAMTHTNVAEGTEDTALSAYDLTLHLLGKGDRYDMVARRPIAAADAEALHPDEVRRERRERRLAERRSGDRRRGGRRAADRADASASGGRRGGDRREDERRGTS